MESGQLVPIGRGSKILPKKHRFLFIIRDYVICSDRQIGISIIQKGSFPVHQPYAFSVGEDIVRLEQVVVTRHHLRIVIRVNRGYFRVPCQELALYRGGEYVRSFTLLEESVQGRSFVDQECARG